MKIDNVTIALMGVRGRGQTMARWFGALPDVDFAYICDVDQNVVGPAMEIVEEIKGKRPPLVSDIRRVLDDPSVDAVVMATPIHWHAPGTILACEAGKDVYVEKPASHNIREGLPAQPVNATPALSALAGMSGRREGLVPYPSSKAPTAAA